ncbi:MAG: molybdopterin-guanine dinucleotide biosynthesis protein B [Methylohalobius sp.]
MLHPPLLGFAAFSGTGKTTLLVRLIPELVQRGLKVGVIKHAHHSFDIDQPGKDSYRLRQAGATPIMVVSSRRRAIVYEYPEQGKVGLFEQLPFLDASGLDLILVEGFKHEPIPKIELHRPALGKPLLFPEDSNIIAVASDVWMACPLPLLDLNQPQEICNFILHGFLSR